MNFWRLLNARIRDGRARTLIVMCAAGLAMAAVVVGLAERFAAEPIGGMPAGLAGALLAVTAAGYGQFRSGTRISQWFGGLSRQIRRAILTKYAALEPPALGEIDGAAIRDALTSLPRGMTQLVTGAPLALTSFMGTLACILVALLVDPVAGAALLLATKFGVIVTTALILRARGGDSTVASADANVDRVLVTGVSAIKRAALAAPRGETTGVSALAAAIDARRLARKHYRARTATSGALDGAGRLVLAALLVGATRLSGESADEVAAMLLIAFLLPLDWIQSIPHLTALSAAADRLAAFEAALHATARRWPTPPVPEAVDYSSLELREAIFRYPAHPGQPGAIVGPVSCRVEPGRVLFVTGATGAGKTSVLLILAGLATPEGGAVLRDGTIVDARKNRGLAAFVPSEPVLFAGTPIANADHPDVQCMIEDLELTGFEEIRSGRVPDPSSLSRGMRARVTLLLAIAENRPLLLIDEWGEGQSHAIRERFFSVIVPRLRDSGRAVVVATISEQHVEVADQIIRLEDGRPAGFMKVG